MKRIYIHRRILNNSIGVLTFTLISLLYFIKGGIIKDVFMLFNKELPIYSVETKEKKAAITFDVADDVYYIDEILDILDRNNVKATFFFIGNFIDRNPQKVLEIYKKGHGVENHGNSHIHFSSIGSEQIKKEVNLLSDKVMKITGKGTVLFRAPYGDYNSNVVKAVGDTGHYFIQWDVDSIDWKEEGEDKIYDRVMKNVREGSIILFHHNYKATVNVLDRIIKDLKDKGFEFVKVYDLIYKENFYIDHMGKQRRTSM